MDGPENELHFFDDPVHLDAYAETLDAIDWRTVTPSSGRHFCEGLALTLEFVRMTDGTCAKEVVVPALNVRKLLPLNTPVGIAIPADATTTYAFACGMGMLKGSVVVR